MPYTPFNRDQTAFKSGKNILASEHFAYTEEGGTLDAVAIGNRYVEVGEPFVRDMATGKYVPFTDAAHLTTGALNTGFADPVVCDIDFDCDGVNDVIVGQLLIKASLYPGKLPASVTDAFKELTHPNMRYYPRGTE